MLCKGVNRLVNTSNIIARINNCLIFSKIVFQNRLFLSKSPKIGDFPSKIKTNHFGIEFYHSESKPTRLFLTFCGKCSNFYGCFQLLMFIRKFRVVIFNTGWLAKKKRLIVLETISCEKFLRSYFQFSPFDKVRQAFERFIFKVNRVFLMASRVPKMFVRIFFVVGKVV